MAFELKILLIDHDTSFLASTSKNLESEGFSVRTSVTVEESLSLLLNERFHVVFIDCMLASQDGLDVARQIRELLGNSLEIIMTSQFLSDSVLEGYEFLNVRSFLKKPLKPTKVNKILKEIQEDIFYGGSNNFFRKIFDRSIPHKDKMKFLFSFDALKDYEFLMLLSGLMSSKEGLRIEFHVTESEKHYLFFKDAHLVNYKSNSLHFLSQQLIEAGWITKEEISSIKFSDPENFFMEVVSEGLISPHQSEEFKILCLKKAFQKHAGRDIQIVCRLSMDDHQDISLDQKFFFNTVLSQMLEKHTQHFQDILLTQAKNRSFEFAASTTADATDKPFYEDIRQGLSFQEIMQKESWKDMYYQDLFRMFLEGSLFLKQDSDSSNQLKIRERYASIHGFLAKTDPKKCFETLKGASIKVSDKDIIKQVYRNFLQLNHSDKFSDLDEKSLSVVNKVLAKIEAHKQTLIEKSSQDSKPKNNIKEAIQVQKMKKNIQSYLEREDYDKAFTGLSKISEDMFSEDHILKLLYLWLCFKKMDMPIDQKRKKLLKLN